MNQPIISKIISNRNTVCCQLGVMTSEHSFDVEYLDTMELFLFLFNC